MSVTSERDPWRGDVGLGVSAWTGGDAPPGEVGEPGQRAHRVGQVRLQHDSRGEGTELGLVEQGEGTPEALASVSGERGLGIFVRSLVGLDQPEEIAP